MKNFNLDFSFAKAWPFGVLMTIQWISALATPITIQLSPYIYVSVGFVIFICWTFFLHSIISWVCHLLGLQKQVFSFGQGFLFVPFAMINFIASILGTGGFSISALICLISTLDYSSGYKVSIVITYLFSTTFCCIAAASNAYFAILLYRNCPNGQLPNLMTIVVEGTRVSTLENAPPPNAAPRMNV